MYKYGLQLYSVRDSMAENAEKTMAEVAKLGYKTVEMAGFYGMSAEAFNTVIRDNGLELSGTHSSYDDLLNKFDETIAFHKAIGNKRYIIPYADLSTAEKIDSFVEKVNILQPLLKKEGIDLQYHNHAVEFLPNSDGLIPQDELRDRTNIMFEIDIYWVYRAGLDPVEVITALRDRISVIHIKDGTMEEDFSLGLGTAPVKEVVYLAKKLGIDMVVESETQNPDGISEVTRCIEFLKTID